MDHLEKECRKLNVAPNIITKARNGDVVAQLELGKAYFNATFIDGNCHTAFKWISRSAKQGNMEAQVRLGDLYALGQGTLKCISDAYKWYTKAAIQGYKKALIRIHNHYQEDTKMHCRGQISSEEEEWAGRWFMIRHSARELNEYRLEHGKLILNHAICYYTKQFKDYQSSNQEDPTVQLNLAFLYQHGYGVKKCIRWAFEYYKEAAEQGDINAQYNLGNLYQRHPDMKFNYRHAFKWYTASAHSGNMAAQRSLAYFYLKGLATDIDYDSAILWYTKAAESGDSESQIILGKLYRKGDYIKQDLSMAVKWYSLAARHGSIVAQNCLSQLYQRDMLDSIEIDQYLVEYFRSDFMEKRLCTKLSMDITKLGDSLELKKLVELARCALIGDGEAMYKVGLKYYHGDKDFAQDQDTGMKWIKHAVDATHKNARSMLANMYKKGDCMEQDYRKAVIWYQTLAKQKDAVAQCNVGVMYREGLGSRRDCLEASKWFIWAAERGDSNAQLYLSRFRFDGVALHKDEKEGLDWLNKSVRQRNVEACHTLSSLYFEGKHYLRKNIKYGMVLLNFAAKHGFIQAQLDMASRYKKGDGVQQDIQKCIHYYKMASNAGSGEAQYELAAIYLQEERTSFDYLKEYDLIKQASDKGYSEATYVFDPHCYYTQGKDHQSRVMDMLISTAEKNIGDLHYTIGCHYDKGVYDCSLEEDYISAMKWYTIASDNGDSRADYRLGVMHENGLGVHKNLANAIHYYKRASLKENADGIYQLSCLYRDGYGVTQDLVKAFHYFTKASMMGHNQAIEALTISDYNFIHLFDDDKLKKEEKIKVNMLEKATEEGYTQLQYQIGVWYESKSDNSSAFEWFNRAANIGVTDAYYRVGVLYEEGRGVEQDYGMAASMYHKAAEKEHEDAYYRLGRLYQYGNGVELNYLKAYQLYKKAREMDHIEAHKVLNIILASTTTSSGDTKDNFMDLSSQEYQDSLSMCKCVAENGDAEVQFQIGFVYERILTEPDYAEAFNWYSMAAKNSHKEAIYLLGLLYEKGLGIPQVYQTAIHLYYRASQLGSDKALHRLGVAHHHGYGVDIDLTKAIEYYIRSTIMDNPEFQYLLGKLYEEGHIVQKNPQEALKWYTRSYLQNYDGASSSLYSMYDDKPYEFFFFTKLFKNLAIASCGHFLLDEYYHHSDYYNLNMHLALFCALGCGTEKDFEKSWKYLRREYESYFIPSMVNLFEREFALNISDKLGILKGFEENEAIMSQLNENELYEFAILLARTLTQVQQNDCSKMNDQDKADSEQHIEIKKDYPRVFRWMKKAADMNHVKAMFQVGFMYYRGIGVEKDTEQGDRWLVMSSCDSLYSTGEIAALFHTAKEIQDFTLAHKWYKRLETLNNEDENPSISELVNLGFGLLYEYGNGVEQSYQKALENYLPLVEDQQSVGIHRLALMYYYGKGVSTDYLKSFDLFGRVRVDFGKNVEQLPFVYNQRNKSDSQDDIVYCLMSRTEIFSESHYYLGLHYKYGQGVPCDLVEAQRHFKEAFDCGCKRAKYEIDDIHSIPNI